MEPTLWISEGVLNTCEIMLQGLCSHAAKVSKPLLAPTLRLARTFAEAQTF